MDDSRDREQDRQCVGIVEAGDGEPIILFFYFNVLEIFHEKILEKGCLDTQN